MSDAQIPADDESKEIDDDLKILNEMDIDKDFNVWSEFRHSFTTTKRESIRQLSTSARRNCSGAIEESTRTMDSISESLASEELDIGQSDQATIHRKESTSSCGGSRSSLYVKFSPLSCAERRDIRSWAVRLEREQVFSRYYFPEAWELREKGAIQKEFLLNEPLKANETSEVTQTTINSIFFPGDHDPKSVLLKRGPILFDGAEERELFLFTHGVVLSRIEFDSYVNLLFDMSSVKWESKKSMDEEMQKRFDALDSDCTGELDRCELREVFQSMGMPIGERRLSELMGRFDVDNSGTIDFQEFKQVLHEFAPKDETPSNTLFGNLRKVLGERLSLSAGNVKRKLDSAFPLADVECVESLHMCHSAKTKIFAYSSWAEVAFAIFIRFRKHPLIAVCSKPEHREAWIDALRICLINSRKLGGNKFLKDDKPGWQHLLIRDSLFSFVVCDDHDGITRFVDDPPIDTSINDRDEYYGYSALHYAVIWDNFHCAALLLANKADVNLKDDDNKTPIDYATNKNMMNLLKGYGGKPSLEGMLYDEEFEEQKSRTSHTKQPKRTTTQSVNKANDVMADTMAAMKERGEKLEKLDNAAVSLEKETANFADMAKQLKEKTKKKSIFGL